MSYLPHLIILGVAGWLIGRRQPDQWIFYTALLLKLIAGVCLGYIFKNYYWGGDTFHYYQAAEVLANRPLAEWWQLLGQSEIGYFPNQPRAILFTKIVSGFVLLTQGDYWIVACYFSFISFLAYWYFYRQVITTLPNIKWPVIIGFLLVPSTIFWSSGILKDTLTNASVVFVAAFMLKLFYRKKIHFAELLVTVLALVVLYFIKYYLLILLLPLMMYALTDRSMHRGGVKTGVRAGVYGFLLLATLLIAPSVNPNLNVLKLPEIIHRNQQEAFVPTPDDSSIHVRIAPTWPSLITSLPHALIIGLYGPSVFDTGSVWSWIPKLENLVLVLLTLFSLVLLWRQQLFSPDILVVAALIFIFTLAAMLPLAAPNFGALVRYKATFTPFLFTVLTILPCWHYQNRMQSR